MKISYLKILITLILLFVLSILNLEVFNVTNIYILCLVLLAFCIITKLIIGYEKDRNSLKKDALMNIFIYVMIFHIITYIAGIFIGFVRTIYSLSFFNIIQNIVPIILSIIVVELLRYLIVKKSDKSNKLMLLSVITFVMIDIMFQIILYRYSGNAVWLTIASLAVLPSITKNILFTYTSVKFGFMPAILYRLLTELPAFMLPIFPKFNEYLNSILAFILPLVVLYFIYLDLIKKMKKQNDENDSSLDVHMMSRIISLVLILITILIIFLTSGLFNYSLLSIGSGSMEPNISVGDAVIVKSINKNFSELKVNDILVYDKDGIVVVHRISEISESNGVLNFVTKGDNNNAIDNWVVTEGMIIGTVKLIVPIIGYPTIWLNELIE